MKRKTGNKNLAALSATVLFSVLFLVSCLNKTPKALPDSPTSGNIRIEADESFRPIVDAEISTFISLYKNGKITPVYKPEKDIISDFLNDSVDIFFSAWAPSPELVKKLLEAQVVAKTLTVAHDALAMVIPRDNPDTLLTFDNVKDIFTGKITSWKQINPQSKQGDIKVIFDNEKSANIRYLKERFSLPDQLPSNFFAVKSNPEVVDYVSRTPGSLGVVSVNWISDSDDSASMSFSNKIRVVAVSQEYLDKDLFYKPQQGSIYDKSYPFVRDINIISRESSFGLGSGFTAWVSGEQGQRIILKSGLVPATMPVRLVRINKK